MSGKAKTPARWTRGAERTIVSTRIADVKGVHYTNPGRGTDREFIVISAPDWVNVVALTPDLQVVLVRQFRCGTNDLSLEVPGGVMERGEDPVAAGVRELREETGYEGTGARLLGLVHPNPAIQDNRCHIVLVEGAVRRAQTDWDADEEIEVITAPAAEVLAWARSGRITHSLVHCALLQLETVLPSAS
jgi:ADP-ribose pyrophosphatase